VTFTSTFKRLDTVILPEFAGVRIQLMPVQMRDVNSLPFGLRDWDRLFHRLCSFVPGVNGIAYLTIDQRWTLAGETHRRPGLHVDGMGSWGGGGGWGGNGMITVSSHSGCVAYNREFTGEPRRGVDCGDPDEGDCGHLWGQCEGTGTMLEPNVAYLCNPMCVHESVPVEQDCFRTFVRLSLPNDGVWPRNCTPNPRGIVPEHIGEARRVVGKYSYAE